MKIFKYIKSLFDNNWIDVKTYTKKYDLVSTFNGYELKDSNVPMETIFIIKYSDVKKRFKLTTKGEINKITQPMFSKVLDKVTELNVKLLRGEDIKNILGEI